MTADDTDTDCEGVASGVGGERQESKMTLSIDAILEMLADWRRRELLGYLHERPGHATIDELTEHLLDRESEVRDERPAREDVEIKLLHIHLPKLADAGLVEYDERSRQVRYWGNERLERWLERVRGEANQ